MKENNSMTIAVLAIILSIAAIASAVFMKPALTLGANAISENELADNSVTSDKVVDSTLALQDLSSEVLASMSGVVDILNNSITGDKIANGTIINDDISDSADITPSKISGTAWTADNDGSGSGLDADKLDGINSTQFLRNDTSGTITGDLTVTGNITHQTETRYYTIPHCAFVGSTNNTPYNYSSYVLTNADSAFASHNYYASVNLPDGATVTKITVRYHKEDADANGYVYLEKTGSITSTVATISLLQSSGFTNYATSVSETIVSDNNAYWVRVNLNPNDSQNDIKLSWVCITYTVTNPLP